MVSERPGGVAVDGFVGDIEAFSAGESVQFTTDVGPGKRCAGLGIVTEIWWCFPQIDSLLDGLPKQVSTSLLAVTW